MIPRSKQSGWYYTTHFEQVSGRYGTKLSIIAIHWTSINRKITLCNYTVFGSTWNTTSWHQSCCITLEMILKTGRNKAEKKPKQKQMVLLTHVQQVSFKRMSCFKQNMVFNWHITTYRTEWSHRNLEREKKYLLSFLLRTVTSLSAEDGQFCGSY